MIIDWNFAVNFFFFSSSGSSVSYTDHLITEASCMYRFFQYICSEKKKEKKNHTLKKK